MKNNLKSNRNHNTKQTRIHAPEGLACTCREAPFWKILAFQQVLLQIILSLNLIISNNSAWCLTIYRQKFLSQITIQGSQDDRKFNPWPVTAGFGQENGARRSTLVCHQVPKIQERPIGIDDDQWRSYTWWSKVRKTKAWDWPRNPEPIHWILSQTDNCFDKNKRPLTFCRLSDASCDVSMEHLCAVP